MNLLTFLFGRHRFLNSPEKTSSNKVYMPSDKVNMRSDKLHMRSNKLQKPSNKLLMRSNKDGISINFPLLTQFIE